MDKKKRMEELICEANSKGLFTGSWLYAENGEIVAKGAVGWSDTVDSIPMSEDMIVDLASVSKNFTAAAIMLLRRRGLLDLDDEITRFFPEIPYKGVTLRNLLNHTGGLPDYMEWVAMTAVKENTIPDNDVIVRFLCECGKDADFAPGEKWEYSNTGYCLLAQIVEEVSGEKFEDFMQKNIFDPAGMNSTKIIHRRRDNLAPDNLATGIVLDLKAEKYELPDTSSDYGFVVPLDGMSGDGMVHSNIFDLLKWDRVLRAGTVLTKEEQEMMYTPGKLNSGEDAVAGKESDAPNYGFGWEVGTVPEFGMLVCHSGSWPGYWTWFERYIDTDRTLIMLRCRDPKDARAYQIFFEGMKNIVKGKEPGTIMTLEDIAVADPDIDAWEAYCGEYESPEGEDVCLNKVFVRDCALYGEISLYGGDPCDVRIYQIGENEFGIKKYAIPITFEDGYVSYLGQKYRKK